ncbi:MAG: phenylacetate--CoA ligase family protein, partial [Verrucomicrobiota bacterium]|nr:phenylacetate--CoA ligase family protein [Verrucomicrobiota bacterium]
MSDVLEKLNRLLDQTLASNAFYRSKLSGLKESLPLVSLDAFRQGVPCTTKVEWIADQQAHPPYGTNLTFPMASYVRCHQTSGTTGAPMRWLDTAESWQAMLEAWDCVYAAA